LEFLDHTVPAAANISVGKTRIAVIFKEPTLTVEDTVNKGRTSMTALKECTPLQGGVPIEVDGKAVEAVGVSGAANAQQDQEVALAAARAANRFALQSGGGASSPAPNSGSAAVTYVDKDRVDDSFAKGGVLYPGDGHNYQVLTSRHDKPGQVEIHTLDARGTPLDGKTIGRNEIHGLQLNGLKSPLIGQGWIMSSSGMCNASKRS
jgi:hypothetical protein